MANNPCSAPTADVAERPDPRIAPGPRRVMTGELTPLLLVSDVAIPVVYFLTVSFVVT